MLLAIDIGNTETVMGFFKEDVLHTHFRISSKTARTADEVWLTLQKWFENESIDMKAIEGVVLSSVVPALTTVFNEALSGRIGKRPLIVNADHDVGIDIQYDNPNAVGADRICNGVAGFRKYGGPLIVVDFGTATTFDVISESGAYLGGVIALGLMGASHELHRVSAKLPRVALSFPDQVVGRSTEASVQSGILWGTTTMVDGMVVKIRQEMRWDSCHVVATGGMASVLAEKSTQIQHLDVFLTLEGMQYIYKHLMEKQPKR